MTNARPSFGSIAFENLQDAFQPLGAYLDTMRASGQRLRMWWRDDDAYRDNEKLRQLLMARRDVPIALAVIPGALETTLVDLLNRANGVSVLQHGWKHINWSGDESRPSEFPETRASFEACEELRQGFQILESSFGEKFQPILVPPWHRFARWLLDARSKLGYSAISMDAPLFPLLSRGCGAEVNVEIDTADWTALGAFIGPFEFTRKLIRAFEIRLTWSAAVVPIGLLSHHALLTKSDFDCLRVFVQLLEKSDVIEWVGVQSLTAQHC